MGFPNYPNEQFYILLCIHSLWFSYIIENSIKPVVVFKKIFEIKIRYKHFVVGLTKSLKFWLPHNVFKVSNTLRPFVRTLQVATLTPVQPTDKSLPTQPALTPTTLAMATPTVVATTEEPLPTLVTATLTAPTLVTAPVVVSTPTLLGTPATLTVVDTTEEVLVDSTNRLYLHNQLL